MHCAIYRLLNLDTRAACDAGATAKHAVGRCREMVLYFESAFSPFIDSGEGKDFVCTVKTC